MPLIDLNGLGHFKDRENAMIAEDFSASKAYAAGDYCYYNGTLYKFKTAHAAGAWTTSDVEAAKLAHDVSDLKTAFTHITETLYKEDTQTNGSFLAYFRGSSNDGFTIPVRSFRAKVVYPKGLTGSRPNGVGYIISCYFTDDTAANTVLNANVFPQSHASAYKMTLEYDIFVMPHKVLGTVKYYRDDVLVAVSDVNTDTEKEIKQLHAFGAYFNIDGSVAVTGYCVASGNTNTNIT